MLAGLATSHKIGIAVAAGIFIAFALASSLLLPRLRPDFPGKRAGLFVAVIVLITAAMLGTVIALAGEPKEPREAAAETATTAPAPTPTGDAAAGKTVFATAGCVGCHTLKAAGATGTVGPNLDQAKPPAEPVVDRVTNGKGVMPSFKGQLSDQQIQDVAAFVSTSAGQ